VTSCGGTATAGPNPSRRPRPIGRRSPGEAFVGSGVHAAHINTVLGARGGPVETAWATALAMPRPGHVAFVCVVRPGLAVKPYTLFVNKAPLAGPGHEKLTWGAAQAGVASGTLEAVADGIIAADRVNELLLIAAVWVDPGARDEGAVYENNRRSAREALEAGVRRAPDLEELLAVRQDPRNPFFGSGL
jgi:5,6,7,8-tetrahydromethanopterin hydro-lyase